MALTKMAHGEEATALRAVAPAVEREQMYEGSVKEIDVARESIVAFMAYGDTVVRGQTEPTSAAQACDLSRKAWLDLFPVRWYFLEHERYIVGDFAQTLVSVCKALFRHMSESDLDRETAQEYAHYLENMSSRVEYLSALLTDEQRVHSRIEHSIQEALAAH